MGGSSSKSLGTTVGSWFNGSPIYTQDMDAINTGIALGRYREVDSIENIPDGFELSFVLYDASGDPLRAKRYVSAMNRFKAWWYRNNKAIIDKIAAGASIAGHSAMAVIRVALPVLLDSGKDAAKAAIAAELGPVAAAKAGPILDKLSAEIGHQIDIPADDVLKLPASSESLRSTKTGSAQFYKHISHNAYRGAARRAKSSYTGGCDCKYIGSGEFDLAVVPDYADSANSKAKTQIIDDIIAVGSTIGLKLTGASREDKIREMIAQMPTGNKFKSDDETHKKLCMMIANAINKASNEEIISKELPPKVICQQVAEMLSSLSAGMHTEFLAVYNDVRRVLRNLHILKKQMDDSVKGVESSFGDHKDVKSKSEPYMMAHDMLSAEIGRQIELLSNLLNVKLAPAERELAALIRGEKSLHGIIEKIDIQEGTNAFGNVIASLLKGFGVTANFARLIDAALKTVGMSIAEYKSSSSLSKLREHIAEKLMSPGMEGDKLHEFLEAAELLHNNFDKSHEIAEVLERTGAGEYGSSNLDKRIKDRKRMKNLIFSSFYGQLNKLFDQMVINLDHLSDKVGTEIPLSDQLTSFTKVITRLSEDMVRNKGIYYALIGFYNDALSRSKKDSFVADVKMVVSHIDALLEMPIYSSSRQYFAAVQSYLKSMLDLIGRYTDEIAAKFGRGEEDAAPADMYSGGALDDFEIEPKKQYRTEKSIKSAVDKLEYRCRVAQIKRNLTATAGELKHYSEKYETLVATSIADILNDARDKMTKTKKTLMDYKTATPPTLNDDEYNDCIKYVDEGFAVRKKFWATVEAVDTYMRVFTDGLVNNPQDIKDIKSMIDSVEVINEWYADDLSFVNIFDMFPANDDSKVALHTGTDHYYEVLTAHPLRGSVGKTAKIGLFGDLHDRAKRAFTNMHALKNLLSIFVHIGANFGGKELRSQVFMTPTQMYNNLLESLKFSTFARVKDKEIIIMTGSHVDWELEQKYFVLIMKSLVAKVLTVLGMYDVLDRPLENNNGLSPIRMIIGGDFDKPKIDPEAVPLYLRLPLLARFYRSIFGFDEKSGVYSDINSFTKYESAEWRAEKDKGGDTTAMKISLVPDIDGTFAGLIRLVFRRNKFISEEQYSEDDMTELVREINMIYQKMHAKHPQNTVMETINEFVAEMNRRYGVLAQSERDKYALFDEHVYDYADKMGDDPMEVQDVAILPGELDDEIVRPSAAEKLIQGDFTGKQTGKKSRHTISDEHRKLVYRFRCAIDEYFKDKPEDYSFNSSIRLAQNKLKHEQNDDKRFNIVAQLVRGEGFGAKIDGMKCVLFHETVVGGLNMLSMIHTILLRFKRRMTVCNLPKMADLIISELTARRDLAHIRQILAEALKNTGLYVNEAEAMPAVENLLGKNEDDHANGGAGSGAYYVKSRRPGGDNIDKTNLFTADPDDAKKEAIRRYAFDNEHVMREIIDAIAELGHDCQGLVNIRIEDKRVLINYNGLRSLIEDMFQHIEYFLNVLRSHMSKETIAQYTDKKRPGSLYWLQEQLVDKILTGRPGRESSVAYETLDEIAKNMSATLEHLTKRWTAKSNGSATNADTEYDNYGDLFASMLFYNNATAAASDIGGAPRIADYLHDPIESVHFNSVSGAKLLDTRYIARFSDLYNLKDGLTDNRSVLVMFNQLVAKFIQSNFDSVGGKMYAGLLNRFAGGSFNAAINSHDHTYPDVAPMWFIKAAKVDGAVNYSKLINAVKGDGPIVYMNKLSSALADSVINGKVNYLEFLRQIAEKNKENTILAPLFTNGAIKFANNRSIIKPGQVEAAINQWNGSRDINTDFNTAKTELGGDIDRATTSAAAAIMTLLFSKTVTEIRPLLKAAQPQKTEVPGNEPSYSVKYDDLLGAAKDNENGTFGRVIPTSRAGLLAWVSKEARAGIVSANQERVIGPIHGLTSDLADMVKFGHRGDPDANHVLFTSLSILIRNMLSSRVAATQGLQYLQDNIADVPAYLKERMRANLPAFRNLFKELSARCELLKKFMDGRSVSLGRGAIANVKVQWPCLLSQPSTASNENKTRFTGLLDSIIHGCDAFIASCEHTLREIGDDPVYFETSSGAIRDYKTHYGTDPLMPLTSMMTALRPSKDAFLPIYELGEETFKFMYGTRGILGNPITIPLMEHAPGFASIIEGFNLAMDIGAPIDNSRADAFLKTFVKLMRYAYCWKNVKQPILGANANVIDVIASGGDTSNRLLISLYEKRAYKSVVPVYAITKSLADTLKMTESSFKEERIKEIVDHICANNDAKPTSDRIIQNIIDLNIVPINVHALMRDIPLANLYNYSYTFDRLILDLYYGDEAKDKAKSLCKNALDHANEVNDTHRTGGGGFFDTDRIPIGSAKDALVALLLDPYYKFTKRTDIINDVKLDTYDNYVKSMLLGDATSGEMGRPKFLSDQLYNKVLFGQLYLSAEKKRESGPAGQGRVTKEMGKAFILRMANVFADWYAKQVEVKNANNLDPWNTPVKASRNEKRFNQKFKKYVMPKLINIVNAANKYSLPDNYVMNLINAARKLFLTNIGTSAQSIKKPSSFIAKYPEISIPALKPDLLELAKEDLKKINDDDLKRIIDWFRTVFVEKDKMYERIFIDAITRPFPNPSEKVKTWEKGSWDDNARLQDLVDADDEKLVDDHGAWRLGDDEKYTVEAMRIVSNHRDQLSSINSRTNNIPQTALILEYIYIDRLESQGKNADDEKVLVQKDISKMPSLDPENTNIFAMSTDELSTLFTLYGEGIKSPIPPPNLWDIAYTTYTQSESYDDAVTAFVTMFPDNDDYNFSRPAIYENEWIPLLGAIIKDGSSRKLQTIPKPILAEIYGDSRKSKQEWLVDDQKSAAFNALKKRYQQSSMPAPMPTSLPTTVSTTSSTTLTTTSTTTSTTTTKAPTETLSSTESAGTSSDVMKKLKHDIDSLIKNRSEIVTELNELLKTAEDLSNTGYNDSTALLKINAILLALQFVRDVQGELPTSIKSKETTISYIKDGEVKTVSLTQDNANTLLEEGRKRFDTNIVRNLVFIVNLYRSLRIKLQRDLTYSKEVTLRAEPMTRNDLTEFYGNQTFRPRR